MSEFLSGPSPEQLMLGGVLAIIADYELDFTEGELEETDLEDDAVGSVMTALWSAGEDAEQVLIDYGVTEEGEG